MTTNSSFHNFILCTKHSFHIYPTNFILTLYSFPFFTLSSIKSFYFSNSFRIRFCSTQTAYAAVFILSSRFLLKLSMHTKLVKCESVALQEQRHIRQFSRLPEHRRRKALKYILHKQMFINVTYKTMVLNIDR